MPSLQAVEKKLKGPILSIQEYRAFLNDNVSSDEQIVKRLEYIEALCRNIIRNELLVYINKHKKIKKVKVYD